MVGTDYPIHLSRVAPERDALLLVGELAGPATFRFLGCPRLVTGDALQHVRTTALSPGKGTATAIVPIPGDPALVGTSFHARWLVSDAGGGRGFVAATAVLRVEIQSP